MIFAITLFFALVTLYIMVEHIVRNTFTNLSEYLPSVTVIVCCNTFLFLVTPLQGFPLMQQPKSVAIGQKVLQ
jgi:hypothetical protein